MLFLQTGEERSSRAGAMLHPQSTGAFTTKGTSRVLQPPVRYIGRQEGRMAERQRGNITHRKKKKKKMVAQTHPNQNQSPAMRRQGLSTRRFPKSSVALASTAVCSLSKRRQKLTTQRPPQDLFFSQCHAPGPAEHTPKLGLVALSPRAPPSKLS
jgi:hypothetical protein